MSLTINHACAFKALSSLFRPKYVLCETPNIFNIKLAVIACSKQLLRQGVCLFTENITCLTSFIRDNILSVRSGWYSLLVFENSRTSFLKETSLMSKFEIPKRRKTRIYKADFLIEYLDTVYPTFPHEDYFNHFNLQADHSSWGVPDIFLDLF